MSMPRIPPSQNSPTPPRDAARPGLRAKTIATRLTPEELQEVESAAERDGKSLAEWLRETTLRSARQRPADPIELLLAELMATRYVLLNLFHATALAGAEGKQFASRFRAQNPRPGRRPEARKSSQAAPGFLRPGKRRRGEKSMRPMQFPRRFPWLIAVMLLAFSGVLCLPPGLWYWLAYPPVQQYYLGAYFESTFMGDHSTVAVPVQWLYKTAPGTKRELAMVGDGVSDSADNDLHLPMKLSPSACAEGWSGLVLGPHERVAADKLSPYLQETFFDGESAWRLLLQPLLWGAAAVLFLLGGGITLQERSRDEERHGRRTKGPELLSALRSIRSVKADGIRFRLRLENSLFGRLPFGPSAEGIVAFVAGSCLPAAEIREKMRRRVPKYMVPTEIRFLSRLPVSVAGKTDHKTLTQMLSEGSA
jgi:hypothetical protein